MSIAVVIAVSRIVLCCAEVPWHASQSCSNVNVWSIWVGSRVKLTKEKAFNREVWASQPRSSYADQTSDYRKGGNKPPPHIQAP